MKGISTILETTAVAVPVSEIVSLDMAALCYLSDGNASGPELGAALGVNRVTAFRVLTRLTALGCVAIDTKHRKWGITEAGYASIRRVASDLDGVVKRIEER